MDISISVSADTYNIPIMSCIPMRGKTLFIVCFQKYMSLNVQEKQSGEKVWTKVPTSLAKWERKQTEVILRDAEMIMTRFSRWFLSTPEAQKLLLNICFALPKWSSSHTHTHSPRWSLQVFSKLNILTCFSRKGSNNTDHDDILVSLSACTVQYNGATVSVISNWHTLWQIKTSASIKAGFGLSFSSGPGKNAYTGRKKTLNFINCTHILTISTIF